MMMQEGVCRPLQPMSVGDHLGGGGGGSSIHQSPMSRIQILTEEAICDGSSNVVSRQRHSSANPLGGGDAHSPRAWQSSIESLTQGLEQICRNKSTPTQRRSSPLVKISPTSTSFESNVLAVPSNHSRPVSECCKSLGSEVVLLESQLIPAAAPMGSNSNRVIRVRHEETEASLKQSLTAICGVGSTPSPVVEAQARCVNNDVVRRPVRRIMAVRI